MSAPKEIPVYLPDTDWATVEALVMAAGQQEIAARGSTPTDPKTWSRRAVRLAHIRNAIAKARGRG